MHDKLKCTLQRMSAVDHTSHIAENANLSTMNCKQEECTNIAILIQNRQLTVVGAVASVVVCMNRSNGQAETEIILHAAISCCYYTRSVT